MAHFVRQSLLTKTDEHFTINCNLFKSKRRAKEARICPPFIYLLSTANFVAPRRKLCKLWHQGKQAKKFLMHQCSLIRPNDHWGSKKRETCRWLKQLWPLVFGHQWPFTSQQQPSRFYCNIIFLNQLSAAFFSSPSSHSWCKNNLQMNFFLPTPFSPLIASLCLPYIEK